jgi:hypothetical protein
MYPSFHSCSTESKEWLAIPGETCTMDAAAFSSGMFNSTVLEDSIVDPLERRNLNGFCDLTLFKHGALTDRKWHVHPESAVAVLSGLRSGGGSIFFKH